ncbi:monovalent cation:proton antiporter-2 (CPA2) family protein [Spirosoma sp. RP8]|uniref:Monovalent cation:proton antiporter-2 (CPA2) family protein n=1 Tax=Spirosoma liriopis TaxID=2937440 RepID=A0ABT0HGL1_9BACT|nr:monovalent cation:proton antiporter-2 (CPA2) family protein [Spirosoma liriopis]MCK8491297.1 monovalent cation:proton antiporter-2 (CPA2) family protein [Spirosoma liriopis]
MQQTFFFQAMVYLASAVITVPIAKKLGLGSVLGYLLAGIIIGPAGLEFIGQEGTDIMHFAEFGVVIMLFVIGLELEPSRLWHLRKSILGMGGVQVGATSLVVAGLAILFGIDWKQALALGMIASLSSTAIVLQSLNEKGLMKTAAGQSSFAVLLFQDIAVIPMLALFPLLASDTNVPVVEGGHSHTTLVDSLPAWLQPFVVLGSVAAIIAVGRYATPPLFRIIARTGMREMFTATALLLVVGIAVLMTTVGLSPALGTFLAGVVLANSEYRHELESDIDPFKGLLLGLFFIAVGASIDFQLVMANPGLILSLVLGIMACKLIVLFLLGKSFSLSNNQNSIFSFGLSQVGEFAFVLFSFSLQEGILSKEITDTMTAVVAISMAFTPLVMLLNEKLMLPRLTVKQDEPEKESDLVEQDNPVIIAGYGHFGSTIGRFLQANNVQATVLDSNSDNVDYLRRMGFNVFYGDASRHDLLEIAGAARAKVIVIAIGDEAKRLELIETIKKHFPELHILVRSTNRYDAYDLMNAGMLHIYRETLDTSLRVGVDALTLLGYRAHEANRSAKTFFIHDERTLKRLSAIRNDDEYVHAVRETQSELEQILQADRTAESLRVDEGWDEGSLIAENNELVK